MRARTARAYKLPRARALNAPLRDAQLLYLPAQVIRAVPPIRQLVEAILAEDTHGHNSVMATPARASVGAS